MTPRLPGTSGREASSSKGSSCFDSLMPQQAHLGLSPGGEVIGGGHHGFDVVNHYKSSGSNNDQLLKDATGATEVRHFAGDAVSVTSSERVSFAPNVQVFTPDNSPPAGYLNSPAIPPHISLDMVRLPCEEPELLNRKKDYLEGTPSTPQSGHHHDIGLGNALAQDMHRILRCVDEKIDKLAWEVGLVHRRLEPTAEKFVMRRPQPRSVPSPTPSLDSHKMARELAKSMPTLPTFPRFNSASSSDRRGPNPFPGPGSAQEDMVVHTSTSSRTRSSPRSAPNSKRSSRVLPGDAEAASKRKVREPREMNGHLPSFREDSNPCSSDTLVDLSKEPAKVQAVTSGNELQQAASPTASTNPTSSRPRLTREDSRTHPFARHNAASKAGKGVELLFRKKRGRSDGAKMVWSILEHPADSWVGIIYDKFVLILTFISVLVAVAQTVEHDYHDEIGVFAVELCLDVFFVLEVALRIWSCPSKSHFFFSAFNCIDVVSLIPAGCRTVLCIRNWQASHKLYDVPEVILAVMPSVRLLKMLRRFKSVKLLSTAFKNVLQSLPVLLYTMASISFFFAGLIVLVEPRSNVHSLPHAIWLTIVTMTTVGYGDITPTTKSGFFAVSALVIVSVLFMAMPIGIIGHSFTIAWSDRKQILLIERTRELLQQAGYTPEDMHVLFSSFDYNIDGYLDLHEFRSMFNQIGCGLNQTDLTELFEFIDRDRNGGIDDIEFVRAVFAKNFNDYRSSQGQSDDDEGDERQSQLRARS